MAIQRRWLSSRSVPSPPQELAIKNELEIRKLHEGDSQHTTSGGGSFGGGWQPVSNSETFRHIEQQLADREEKWSSPSTVWSASNSTLPKAPSFKIIPVSQNQPFATIPRVIHRPYSTHRHVGEQSVVKELNKNEIEREIYKNARLHGLLDCCQAQAPGCRHLCSKDVSKEEIKKAITSQQCAPLQMTSVIQCFPRFYNTTFVSKCCAKPNNLEANELVKSEVTGLLAKPPTELPEQCLSLCAPDFKLTFAHFACIDHISTIVECYRDLMR
uniref:DB domain-containing protein n=1 Tax=Ditylenchus dipsaci TaxID=166011 RepID=A0A915D7L0_9BILA